MASLLDIAPAGEKIPVRTETGPAQLEVYGVSAKGVAVLLGRFPELRLLMTGRGNRADPDRLMEMGGDVVAAIIAAGAGHPGSEEAEAIAGRFPVEEQADLLAAILRLTLPNGLAPFVAKLAALGGILNTEASATAPGTRSRKPSKS